MNRKEYYFRWFLLSFLAGSMNAGGFLACGKFVSHVTGFATLVGVDLAFGRFADAWGMLTVPLFFVFGVMISTVLMENRQRGFKIVMCFISVNLLICAFGGFFNWFGGFDSEFKIKKDFIFLSLLCLSSGLQNASVSIFSDFNLRTTHLTGITTDFGMSIVRLWKERKTRRKLIQSDDGKSMSLFQKERDLFYLRAGIIFSFMQGSLIGSYFFLKFAYLGFLLPACIGIYLLFDEKIAKFG